MALQRKPYLVIPKLIEQPTWGGDYILSAKAWKHITFLRGKKIGQSYELFSGSKLHLTATDTNNPGFIPEIGFADKPDILKEFFPQKEGVHYVSILAGGSMSLLNKFTQAAGNSFQLHIKPETTDPHWRAKPESWYYFEKGYLTLGLRSGCNVEQYKEVCLEINSHMEELSRKIKADELSLKAGEQDAATFIKEKNPWQFVNRFEVLPDTLIDLSMGGVHHSWEENKEKFPLGNVLYEVQIDTMDPVSTIRSFDQGKIKKDGSIRPLNIDDYFKHLDTDPSHNVFKYFEKKARGSSFLKTKYYSLDTITVSSPFNDTTTNSFSHLFVRTGAVRVQAAEGEVTVGEGHSCYIPKGSGDYTVTSHVPNSVILKTYT